MKKIAIIGASYLQEPLIQKAKQRNVETHVFAWECGDIGEKSADYFYPISIVEKDLILDKCREIGVDGICTIASDLAVVTVNYVAEQMGLIGNSMECTLVSTNKAEMRKRFVESGVPSPASVLVSEKSDLNIDELKFPLIVKPTDRSGSRGVTKVYHEDELDEAISLACSQGFQKKAVVEEFATGLEYSVEFISWKGRHQFLNLTRKYTTGAPGFVETGHIEPAPVSPEMLENVKKEVTHALNSLGIEYGASHSELKISEDGTIRFIEIGGRMGGDFIGSSLVELSTGYDFVGAVLDVALGIEPSKTVGNTGSAAVRFVFDKSDIECLECIEREHPEMLVEKNIHEITNEKVTDSSSRFGYFIIKSDSFKILEGYMPTQPEE